jgi:hypothetical protein
MPAWPPEAWEQVEQAVPRLQNLMIQLLIATRRLRPAVLGVRN